MIILLLKKFCDLLVEFQDFFTTEFHDFFTTAVIFHDFPGLENSYLKFHDFTGCAGTLYPAKCWPCCLLTVD